MAQPQTLSNIQIKHPDEKALAELNVFSWPIWTKEACEFNWRYDEPETCFFLEGDVVIKTIDGDITIGKGDLVTFPKGLNCTWNIKQAVRKHYSFG